MWHSELNSLKLKKQMIRILTSKYCISFFSVDKVHCRRILRMSNRWSLYGLSVIIILSFSSTLSQNQYSFPIKNFFFFSPQNSHFNLNIFRRFINIKYYNKDEVIFYIFFFYTSFLKRNRKQLNNDSRKIYYLSHSSTRVTWLLIRIKIFPYLQ